jgi:hypothetical protein
MTTILLACRPRQDRRRSRRSELAIESMEERLAPSQTLPLPPLHVAILFETSVPQVSPSTVGNTFVAAHYQPPDPC